MKIICVARNYAEHARELKNDIPDKPIIFIKPDTALKRKTMPFFLPHFSRDVHYETEIVLRISKNGKNIDEKFAHKYFDALTVGIDFTARDLQGELKLKGWPWEIAKGFDGAACVGDFKMTSELIDLDVPEGNIRALNFCMYKNKVLAQKGSTKDMIFSYKQIISYISGFFSLLKGDLIFTGTPAGVGPVTYNDHIECFLEDESVLEFDVK
ncbi:MAG: fumarylacetoacetate hydrolase family protein [Chitinophagales bacterium]|jgi:2-keto-4-pentenoate hydratase/2-oxohepta-3-ene-1,7-dioic acid hydratase in catechol pathway|nr:fumarylacetoacetate hydrolase family protein [Chitinophagales bacterium]